MDEQLKIRLLKYQRRVSFISNNIMVAEHKSGDVYTENTTESDNAIYLSLKATTGGRT